MTLTQKKKTAKGKKTEMTFPYSAYLIQLFSVPIVWDHLCNWNDW